jgi:hypothetical protein
MLLNIGFRMLRRKSLSNVTAMSSCAEPFSDSISGVRPGVSVRISSGAASVTYLSQAYPQTANPCWGRGGFLWEGPRLKLRYRVSFVQGDGCSCFLRAHFARAASSIVVQIAVVPRSQNRDLGHPHSGRGGWVGIWLPAFLVKWADRERWLCSRFSSYTFRKMRLR